MFKNLLSNEDKKLMEATIQHYLLPVSTEAYVEGLVELWNEGKKQNTLIQQLFNDRLTINLGRVEDILSEEQCDIYREHLTPLLRIICHRLFYKTIHLLTKAEHRALNELIDFIEKSYLIELTNDINLKQWINNSSAYARKFKIGDKTFAFHKGQKMGKVLRMIQEISYTYGLNKTEEPLDIEEIMTKVSQIKSKSFTGDLILSIHPMDFLTCSDNAHNWTSCMSIKSQGEYCAATLEAMQSENVIIAYVQSNNKKYYINSKSHWNSKKWRMFIHLTEDLLITNKQYPFAYNELSQYLVNYIYKTLNLEKQGYKQVSELSWEQVRGIRYCSTIMYDDYDTSLEGQRIYASACDSQDLDMLVVNFNTVPLCPICQEKLDSWNWDIIGCNDCIDLEWCEHCGGYVLDTMHFIDSQEAYVCGSCLDQYFRKCECCGDYFSVEDLHSFREKSLCLYCVEEQVVYCDTCQKILYLPEEGIGNEEGVFCNEHCYKVYYQSTKPKLKFNL